MTPGSKLTDDDRRIETIGASQLDDRDELEELYRNEDGNVSAVSRRLGYSKSHVRNVLIELGIHEEVARTEFSLAARLEAAEPSDVGGKA